MPCISARFDPQIGPILNIGVTQPGAVKGVAAAQALASSQQTPAVTAFPMLLDTGADITCISPQIMQQIGLRSIGKRSASTPSGPTSLNTYLADIAIPFGDVTKGAVTTYAIDNVTVMEFLGASPHYQGLIGMDVLGRGLFSVAGYDSRFTFCL